MFRDDEANDNIRTLATTDANFVIAKVKPNEAEKKRERNENTTLKIKW